MIAKHRLSDKYLFTIVDECKLEFTESIIISKIHRKRYNNLQTDKLRLQMNLDCNLRIVNVVYEL